MPSAWPKARSTPPTRGGDALAPARARPRCLPASGHGSCVRPLRRGCGHRWHRRPPSAPSAPGSTSPSRSRARTPGSETPPGRRTPRSTLSSRYVASTKLLRELVEAGDLDATTAPKAEFAAGLISDTLAPTNMLLTNPTAWRALETCGFSVLARQSQLPARPHGERRLAAQVDSSPLHAGRERGRDTGQGRVPQRADRDHPVRRRRPTTSTRSRCSCCPPWINRYYIADLAPKKSLIEWAVRHGHTTFAISYRNPDESMRDNTFDDYLRLGPLTAIDVARRRSRAPKS